MPYSLQTAFHGAKAETTVQEAGRGIQLVPSFLTSLPPRRLSYPKAAVIFNVIFNLRVAQKVQQVGGWDAALPALCSRLPRISSRAAQQQGGCENNFSQEEKKQEIAFLLQGKQL